MSIFVYLFCFLFFIFRICFFICNNFCLFRIGFKSNKKVVLRWVFVFDDGFDFIWKGSDLYFFDDEDFYFKNWYVLWEFYVFFICKVFYVNNNFLYIFLCGKFWKFFLFKIWFGDVFRYVMFIFFIFLFGLVLIMCKKVGLLIYMFYGKLDEICEL